MPPFVKQILELIVRAAVLWAAGFLTARFGISLTESQIASTVAFLVPAVAVVAWSIYGKYFDRQKLLTALAAKGVMTEHEVEAKVSDPQSPTPSVLTRKDQVPQ